MYTTHNFTIFPLGHQEFDTFFGHGWENWARFRRENKILKLIKGQPLPKDLYEHLLKEINNVNL